MGEKNNREGEIKYVKTFFGAIVFLMLLLFIVGQVIFPDERSDLSANCKEFESEWQQVLENGEKVPVEVPGKLSAEYGEIVTISTYLPDDLEDNNVICFRSIWQDVEIYVDGELRTSYNTDDSRPFGKNSAFRYIFVDLNEEDAGKELQYSFSSESKYAGTVRTSYIGDKLGIWTHLIRESGAKTIITIFLLFLSLFCIVVCVILKWVYKKTLPLNYLVWTMLFCSIWMLSEIEFRQIMIKNVSILTYYTYMSLMTIPIPLLIYINEIQGGRYKKCHIVPMVYVVLMFVIGVALQVFNVVEFVEMLPYIHVGLIMATISTIATITVDVIKRRIADYVFVGIGVYGLLFSAVIEMILYYVDLGISIGTFVAIGLMFLLVMAIIKTGQDLMRSEKKKQQAIVAREAQAKFLANMSHEIRTPINAVIGMNEMILRESKDEDIREYAVNIKSASNMLLSLVSDILDFSKIESGQFEIIESTYDLASMIKDTKLILNTRASGKQLSVKIDIDSNLPSKLYGDDLRIKQIVTNLISNAVKYTKEGSVTLKANFGWLDADNIQLSFSVIDTGIGIKKEDMSELFDNFKRLELDKNRNVQGTGLGLSIVKQLTDLMKGQVIVESEYGKGSTFTISIPQKVMDKKPIGNIEEVLKKVNIENSVEENKFVAPEAKILIVDDNVMNLSVIKELLKRTQIQVDAVASGKECLKLTSNNKYDIILLDHMMPELDGVAALQMIRKDYSNLNQNGVIIALTANAVAGCREMYLEYGFTDYFSKPIQADKLDELLINYLPKQLIHKERREIKKEFSEVKVTHSKNVEDEIFEIDHDLGLSYCLGKEELYKEVLSMFCEQCEEYLPQLEKSFKENDWQQYIVITHGLKGNALNIGAVNFSKLSLQHEQAGKNNDIEYIQKEYDNYVEILNSLINIIKKMI